MSRAEPVGADLCIVLSSTHVHAASAREQGEGYLSPLVLLFRNARCSRDLAHAPGRVAGGELRADGQTLSILPLPYVSARPVQCRLALGHGTVLDITAPFMHRLLDGGETFVESYAC